MCVCVVLSLCCHYVVVMLSLCHCWCYNYGVISVVLCFLTTVLSLGLSLLNLLSPSHHTLIPSQQQQQQMNDTLSQIGISLCHMTWLVFTTACIILYIHFIIIYVNIDWLLYSCNMRSIVWLFWSLIVCDCCNVVTYCGGWNTVFMWVNVLCWTVLSVVWCIENHLLYFVFCCSYQV